MFESSIFIFGKICSPNYILKNLLHNAYMIKDKHLYIKHLNAPKWSVKGHSQELHFHKPQNLSMM